MSKLSNEALEKIIQQQMPGHRILRREPSAEEASYAGLDSLPTSVNTNADAVSPDLEALKIKYLGADYRAKAAGLDTRHVDSGPAGETELIIVQADEGQDSFDRGPGPKGVIVDEDGKIVGQQG